MHVGHHAITRIIVDQDAWHHKLLLGHNECTYTRNNVACMDLLSDQYVFGLTQWKNIVTSPAIGSANTHDDVIKWKHFPRYWPFVRGIQRSPVNFPHKGQWRRNSMFSLIWGWWFETPSRPVWRHCNDICTDNHWSVKQSSVSRWPFWYKLRLF